MNLTTSKIYFEERDHSYTDEDGRVLSGITGLIHSVLRLGIYPDADEYVRQVTIPMAGYYGKCVHQSIFIHDTLGIDATKYDALTFDTKDFGQRTAPSQDVGRELDNYVKTLGNRKVIASEFTVDYGDYASQIDSVWQDGRSICLVDFKTNNLDAYPGGKQGLQAYLSWQLSCYAFMFEKQTGKKVKKLIGLWLRGEEIEEWDIERQPDADVKKLLETELVRDNNGRFSYFNPDMQVEEVKPVVADGDTLAVPVEITTAIADLIRAEKAAKAMKERLREMMEENGITKWECDAFTASIGKASVKNKFNEKAFKADNPELYQGYIEQIECKGAFRITPKQ